MESRPMGKLGPTGTGAGAGGSGTLKERKKRERWLLTRKTWRYMADAGRRLVPEGHDRPEDLPKIEEYFQEACAREPGFLLWRKQSYPGALGFRRARSKSAAKKRSSCRERERTARSADEADEPRIEEEPELSPRLRAEKLRREFLFGKCETPGGAERGEGPGSGDGGSAGYRAEADRREFRGAGVEYGDGGGEEPRVRDLSEALHGYLYRDRGGLDTEALLRRLREHLADVEESRRRPPGPGPVAASGHPPATGGSLRPAGGRDRDRRDRDRDPPERSLLATLSRHFGKTPDRQRTVSDLLTDRKKLEKLYFELRRTRGFSAGRRERAGSSGGGATAGAPFGRGGRDRGGDEGYDADSTPLGSPPLVEVESDPRASHGTQTESIAPHSWVALAEESRKLRAAKETREEREGGRKSPPPGSNPRRSSVDHDDVSPSVSDTIKRYLRMARKKSVDSDKADRFKRVNYDRNLRNIKPKGEITSVGDDDGLDKGAQTEESWIEALRSLKIESPEAESAVNSSRSSLTEEPVSPVSPTSKTFLSSGQTFLSNLLHGLQDKTVSTGGMQKSKSSTSVVQGSRLVAKKIWKSRSKSQSRATPSATSAWTPQGRCIWSNVAGRSVSLSDTCLPQLTEIERRVLQKVALAKLQALNLGVNIKIPSESSTPAAVQKPKRRAYLLKRKAITTSVFDTSRKDEKDKAATGMVFGVPLGQCVENERARMCPRIEAEDLDLRRKSHHGSRGSFSSLIETPRPDEGGSCESLISPTLSMPGLDNISCGSTQNLVSSEGGVPNVVVSCLRHLENHGLHTLGIFRVSSSKKRVRQLREEFDCGKEINLENDLCPHDVATLLKEYFRDLPDPLLCKDLYQAFIQTQKIRNRRLQHEALQHLLQLLPVANRDTLWSLLNTLSLVAVNSNDQKNNSGEWILGNKMDSSNLATLFAPNLLHSCSKPMSAKDELSAERAEERSDAINVIRCLIDNYKTLFQVSAELLDEVYLHMMDSHPEALDQLLRRRDTTVDERPERGRERLSRKRREEVSRKRLESESSSRRTSSTDDKTRMSSSDSGRLTPDESNTSDGVITASLKIPVPPVTSFSLNLDDIPFIEDSDKQHITLGLLKSSSSQHVTSESGIGSFSPPTRPPSVTSWGSTPTSPECEPTTAIISFPPKQQAVLQKVTIKSTGEIHQVQPSYSRSESYNAERRSYQQHLLTTEKISKSASTSTVPLRESERVVSSQEPPERSERAVITPSISSIGGAVLRSKTADIERMLRLQSKTKKPAVSSVSIEKEFKRRYADTRHLTRHLQSEDRGEASSTSSSRVESRSIWKRHELISSEPKERRSFF